MPAVPSPSNTTVFYLMIAVIIDSVSINLIRPYLPEIGYDYQLNNIDCRNLFYSLLLGFWGAGCALGNSMLGAFSDYYGRKSVTTASIVGSAISFLSICVGIKISSWFFILLGRFGCGFFSGVYNLIEAAVYDGSPSDLDKKRNMPNVHLASSIGEILAGVTIYVLGDYLNKNVDIFFPAVISSVLSLWNIYWVNRYMISGSTPANANLRYSFRHLPQKISHTLRKPNIKHGLLVYFLYIFSVNVVLETVPAFLSENLHYNATSIAIFASLEGLGCIAANVLWKYLLFNADSNKLLVKIEFLLVCNLIWTTLIVLFKCDNYLLISTVGFLQGMLQGCYYISLISTFSMEISPEENGTVMGIMGSIFGITFLASSVVYAILATYSKALVIMIGTLAIAMASLVQNNKRHMVNR